MNMCRQCRCEISHRNLLPMLRQFLPDKEFKLQTIRPWIANPFQLELWYNPKDCTASCSLIKATKTALRNDPSRQRLITPPCRQAAIHSNLEIKFHRKVNVIFFGRNIYIWNTQSKPAARRQAWNVSGKASRQHETYFNFISPDFLHFLLQGHKSVWTSRFK